MAIELENVCVCVCVCVSVCVWVFVRVVCCHMPHAMKSGERHCARGLSRSVPKRAVCEWCLGGTRMCVRVCACVVADGDSIDTRTCEEKDCDIQLRLLVDDFCWRTTENNECAKMC